MKTINLKRAAKCVMALPFAIGLLPSESAGQNLALPERGSEHSAAVIPSSFQLAQATFSSVRHIKIWREPRALSYAEERRFHKLAIKEAMGTISFDEKEEIDALDSRRTVDKPLPTDAIVARERLFSKIDELVKKLGCLER
jgi:hypothetical protein